MRFVIDTNIIFSGLIRDSITRKILLSSEFEFFIPDFYLVELKKYKAELLEKMNTDEQNLNKLIALLLERVTIVPENEYFEKMEKAEKIIGKIDSKDVPFVALALTLNIDGIWSNDTHFSKQKEIHHYSTQRLINILNELIKKI
jgi:predicted nucleic acid-binding protein